MMQRALAALWSVYRVRNEHVLNVYLLGSRLWGSHHPSSDYDLVVVTCDGAFGSDVLHGHTGAFDIQLLSMRCFMDRLRDHDLIALLCCFLPAEHIWRERAHISPTLVPSTLAAACLASSNRSWERARKDCVRGQAMRARKGVAHAVHQRALALQLISAGAVSDFAMQHTLCLSAEALTRDVSGSLGTKADYDVLQEDADVPCPLWASLDAGPAGQIFRQMGATLLLSCAQQPSGVPSREKAQQQLKASRTGQQLRPSESVARASRARRAQSAAS